MICLLFYQIRMPLRLLFKVPLILGDFGALLLLLLGLNVNCELYITYLKSAESVVKEDKDNPVLKNADINLKIDCTAKYPVEWVFNVPFKPSPSQNSAMYGAWSYRDFDLPIDNSQFSYKARIEIKYTAAVKVEEIFTCKSVTNSTDAVYIFITPVPELRQINVTKSKILPAEKKQSYLLAEKPASEHIIYFTSLEDGGYYWKCTTTDGNPQNVSIVRCISPMSCANMYREIRNNPKFERVQNKTRQELLTEGGWHQNTRENVLSAGIIICAGNSTDSTSAIEFFFGGVRQARNENSFSKRELHLNYNEIDMNELIWFGDTVFEEVYYTRENLNTKCNVSFNGFSFLPASEITKDGLVLQQAKNFKKTVSSDGGFGSSITWYKDLSLVFAELGTGNYTIQCIAPIWNSTEWANKTVAFQVRAKIFKGIDILSLQEDAKDVNIECDVIADPKPIKIEWTLLSIPGSYFRHFGFTLVLGKTAGFYADENYTCTATNKFGQHAKKTFNIKVDKSISGGDTTTIIIIVCSLAAVLLVAFGIVFFYFRFKFHDLHSKITTQLTKEEVEEFREGRQNSTSPTCKGGDGEEELLAIDCLPYNSNYEVPNWNCILGSGEYGIVYKGIVANRHHPNQPPIPAAIKTVRKNVHVNYFKALMSELKILAYIGHHENVASLLGAWTENIQNREMLVCVELCENSLLKFLQGNKRSFTNVVQKDGKFSKEPVLAMSATSDEYGNAEVINYISARNNSLDNYQLITWSYQIACGMEFLTSKKVVHADLAARNVLLSAELQAKICDFGLARQLIDYDYVKSENCPLPWKWMAIESLSQRTFNSKTDVWAYGITLWEIFSLGNVPYPGLNWTVNFVEELVRGLRMAKPEFADDAIYNVMLESWRDDPNGRPNFTKLKDFFKSIQLELPVNSGINIV